MKRLRFLVFLLALLLSMSTLYVGVSAQSFERKATISFYNGDGGGGDNGGGDNGGGGNGGGGGGNTGGGGGSGGGTSRRDPPTGSLGDGFVTILDPEIPLADLGDLPKTGGYLLIPLLLLSGGAWLAYVALRESKQGSPVAC